MLDFSAVFLAYLDPGTGSLVLQLVAAMLFSTGLLFRKVIFAPFAWLYLKLLRRQG